MTCFLSTGLVYMTDGTLNSSNYSEKAYSYSVEGNSYSEFDVTVKNHYIVAIFCPVSSIYIDFPKLKRSLVMENETFFFKYILVEEGIE